MWSLTKGVLTMLDGLIDILNQIWRFSFFNNEYVQKLFGYAITLAIAWLVVKVSFEFLMKFIVKGDDRTSPLTIYKGIIIAIISMFLIVPFFDYGQKISTLLTDGVIQASSLGDGANTEFGISKAIITSMVYSDETKQEHKEEFINNWRTVDINSEEKNHYKYSINFFMLLILSIVAVFLLFFVGLQMTKRSIELALYKIISPFVSSTLTNDQSKVFSTWFRSTMGIFLITIVQFISLGLVINILNTSNFNENNLVAVFFTLGSLLFIVGTPTLISSLLDQQSGALSSLNEVRSIMAVGSGVKAGIGIATGLSSKALSIGSFVGGGAMRYGRKGIKFADDHFKNKTYFTEKQKATINDDLKRGQFWSAGQKANEYAQEQFRKKYHRDFTSPNFYNSSNSNNFKKFRNNHINRKEDK